MSFGGSSFLVFTLFSLLLLSGCSGDDEGNVKTPYVGQWQSGCVGNQVVTISITQSKFVYKNEHDYDECDLNTIDPEENGPEGLFGWGNTGEFEFEWELVGVVDTSDGLSAMKLNLIEEVAYGTTGPEALFVDSEPESAASNPDPNITIYITKNLLLIENDILYLGDITLENDVRPDSINFDAPLYKMGE